MMLNAEAAAILIRAMGMFIHDLDILKSDRFKGVYTEDCYERMACLLESISKEDH